MPIDKDITKLVNLCRKQGGEVTHNKHFKIKHPSGKIVVMSGTPHATATQRVKKQLRAAGFVV